MNVPAKVRGGVLLGCVFCLAAAEGAVAQSATHCDGYARDYATRNSRGPIAGGAVSGAIGGSLLGGIIRGGRRGVGAGALIGGGIGALLGGAQRSRDYNSLYLQAYNSCMRRR